MVLKTSLRYDMCGCGGMYGTITVMYSGILTQYFFIHTYSIYTYFIWWPAAKSITRSTGIWFCQDNCPTLIFILNGEIFIE